MAEPAESWQSRSACAATSTDMYFPVEHGRSRADLSQTKAAKAVCGGCPVREECLAYALDRYIEHGIWGGLTSRERRLLAKRRSRTPKYAQAPAAAVG